MYKTGSMSGQKLKTCTGNTAREVPVKRTLDSKNAASTTGHIEEHLGDFDVQNWVNEWAEAEDLHRQHRKRSTSETNSRQQKRTRNSDLGNKRPNAATDVGASLKKIRAQADLASNTPSASGSKHRASTECHANLKRSRQDGQQGNGYISSPGFQAMLARVRAKSLDQGNAATLLVEDS